VSVRAEDEVGQQVRGAGRRDPLGDSIRGAKPARVAMVIQRLRPYFSGQGVQVEELCRELARRNSEVVIVTAVRGQHPPIEEVNGYRVRRIRSDIPGVPATATRTRFWAPIFALRNFMYLLRHRRSIDVVHVHTFHDALYTSWAFCRLTRRPILFEMTLLGTDDPMAVRQSRNFLHRLRYAIYRRCDGYVAISAALAESYRREGMPDDLLRIIPQGVDTERFCPSAAGGALREKLGLPPDTPVLVFVGSLIERKGIDVLLAAWRQIHRSYPTAHLLLVGKNDFPEDAGASRFLADQVAALEPGAAENLHQIGLVEDVETYLQAADIFLFPSRREGFGTVMVEAMACELPCVVAEMPGITDSIFTAGNAAGIVVQQEDHGALAAATEQLLASPERAREIGRAARQRVAQVFGIETIADAYLDFYADVLKTRRT
jgi:glycosyltransferase involved in cell wall biosynthesis